MVPLPDLLTRMQNQGTGCVAILLVDLRDGAVIDQCGIDTAPIAAVGRIMRDLAAPQPSILAGAGTPQEVIVLSDDCTYVAGRLLDPPHHAVTAICRNTQNLGMIVAVLRHQIEPEADA